jgi:DNA-binding transcriptional ArsR family regulator
MRPGSVAIAAATALLLVAAPALAADGTLTARAHLPFTIEGTHAVSASDAHFLLEGDQGTFDLQVQGTVAEATRVVHRAWGLVNDDPEAQILWHDDVDRIPVDLSGAVLQLEQRNPGFQFYAFESSLAVSGQQDDLLLGALDNLKVVQYELERDISVHLMPPDDSDAFERAINAGTFAGRSESGRLTSNAATFYLYDAVLTVIPADGERETIEAHYRIDEQAKGGIYDPIKQEWTGPGQHTEYIQEYLLVTLTDGVLDASFEGITGSIYAEKPHVDVLGSATIPDAVGTLSVTDEDGTHVHKFRGEDVTLSGDFLLRPHDNMGDRTPVEGDGDFTYVAYGAVKQEYDWAQTLTAVGIGAVLLGIAAWVGKALLGGVGPAVAGYARVSGNEVLEHPGRHEVYERVKAFPGVSFIQLSDQVSFGASTLNYHLRVLEKNGYITSVKDGRYLRFFDRQSGLYAGAKKDAVSALRNPNTAAIAKHILQNPGVPQCDLAAKFSITASTVNWHINRLAGAGLVERQRDAHYTRYYVGEGWASLPADEQARFQAPIGPLVVA